MAALPPPELSEPSRHLSAELRLLGRPNHPLHNLPLHLTSFVGRRRERAEVAHALTATRLLTLTGAGGSGKTRLALQVADDLLERFADGVWLVELAPLTAGDLAPQVVASVLGVREQVGRPLVDTLTDYLRPKTLLLLMDNCEHLVTACADLVSALLRICPHLRVLATSQTPLNVTGEVILPVPPLSLPIGDEDAPRGSGVVQDALYISQYEAVRLFIERATAVQPAFTLTDQNAPAVSQICRRLDGIPLAIELAAARIKMLTPEQVAARLDDRFRLLTTGRRDVLPRHQTLRAAVDWSYQLLPEPERTLLRRLSVFGGGFTLGAAEAVCAGDGIEEYDLLDLVGALVDKSLVTAQQQDAEARYRLLETVRQYGADKLKQAGEAEVVRRRHAEYFLALAELAEPELRGPGQVEWVDRLETEYDNLRAALEWCKTDPSAAETDLRLVAALGPFWYLGGHLHEGRTWLEVVLQQRVDGEQDEARSLTRARALSAAGTLAYAQGDYVRAVQYHEQSLALYRTVRNIWGIAFTLNNIAVQAMHQGHYAEAQTLFKESLDLFQREGDKWGIALVTVNQGYMALEQENVAEAARLFEISLDLWREVGDRGLTAIMLHNLGDVARYQGDYERATRLLEESIAMAPQARNTQLIAGSLALLARIAHIKQDVTRAGALFQQSLKLLEELGDKQGIAQSLEALATLGIERGEIVQATRLFGACEALRAAMNAPLPLSERDEYGQTLAVVRAKLGNDAFAVTWTEGRRTSVEEAIKEALALAEQIQTAEGSGSTADGEQRRLRIEIDEEAASRQVAEITETDYFKELEAQVEELRSE